MGLAVDGAERRVGRVIVVQGRAASWLDWTRRVPLLSLDVRNVCILLFNTNGPSYIWGDMLK